MPRLPFTPPVEALRPGALPAEWWRNTRSPGEQSRDMIDAGRAERYELNEEGQLASLGLGGDIFRPRKLVRLHKCADCESSGSIRSGGDEFISAEALASHRLAAHAGEAGTAGDDG